MDRGRGPSFRHFIGTVEQKQRGVLGNQIENIFHLVDFSIERQLTPRFSVGGSRAGAFRPSQSALQSAGQVVVNSIGDIAVGGRAWIFKPPTESGDNISVGIFLKLPTGKYNAGERITFHAKQKLRRHEHGGDRKLQTLARRVTGF